MATAPKLAAVPVSQSRLEPGDILTPQELAKRLKVPLSWVYKKSAQRTPDSLPVLRCGMYLRFSWPDVCAWLRSK
jgi:hypothetical protein